MSGQYTEKRKYRKRDLPIFNISLTQLSRHTSAVLTQAELLGLLATKEVPRAEIARVLDVAASAVTNMYKDPELEKRQSLKLDDAAKLVAAFGLDEPEEPAQTQPPEPPLPSPIARLVVRYLAVELGQELSEERVLELGEDVRAFVQFVADPNVADPIRAAEDFFRMIRIRRTSPEPTDRG